jgi:small subunit ribosomal protein S15
MSITVQKKSLIIEEHAQDDKNTGLSEVQIALLTERIVNLTTHMQEHKNDCHTRRGLMVLVSKRKRLLKYLKNSDEERYLKLIEKLGLRK